MKFVKKKGYHLSPYYFLELAMATNPSSATIRRRKNCRSLRRRDGLIQYARDNTSQNGEDGIIAKIFDILPSSQQRWCVDVG